ncbi:hypothetical protein V6N13_037343 [Hibiscus sabdariffa]
MEHDCAGDVNKLGGVHCVNNFSKQRITLINGAEIRNVAKPVEGNPDNEGRFGPIFEPRECLPPSGGICLREVPILVESESLGSSGQNASFGPCFDPSTGLFTIKPKILKRPDTQISMGFVPKASKIKKQWMSSSDKSRTHAKGKVKKGVSVTPLTSSISISSNKEERIRVEAKESMEVCAAVGLTFDASQEEIIKRFVEVEKEIVD